MKKEDSKIIANKFEGISCLMNKRARAGIATEKITPAIFLLIGTIEV